MLVVVVVVVVVISSRVRDWQTIRQTVCHCRSTLAKQSFSPACTACSTTALADDTGHCSFLLQKQILKTVFLVSQSAVSLSDSFLLSVSLANTRNSSNSSSVHLLSLWALILSSTLLVANLLLPLSPLPRPVSYLTFCLSLHYCC